MVTRVTSESRPEESRLRLPRTLAQEFCPQLLTFPNYFLQRISGCRRRREKPRFLPSAWWREPQRDCQPRDQPVSRRRANIRAESLRRNYPPRPLHPRIRLSLKRLTTRSLSRCAIAPSLPNLTPTRGTITASFCSAVSRRQTALLSEPHAHAA